jgi:O-antigen/teichoic acid export membrane protein
MNESRILILNAYVVATTSALGLALLSLIGLVALRSSDWAAAQGIPASDVVGIVAVCQAAFLVSIPIALIGRVRYATGAVTEENLWQAASSVFAAAAFIVCVKLGASPTAAIGAAAFAIPCIGVVSSISYFSRKRWLIPRALQPTWQAARPLITMGGWFLAIGLVSAVAQNADLLVVSGLLSLGDSATLSVAIRLTGLLSTFFMLVTLPLWPAAGAALADGDIPWVRRTTRRMAALAVVVVAVPGLLMATLLDEAIRAWLGQESANPPPSLMLAMVMWNLVLAVSSPYFMVQNAAGVLVPQFVGWSVFLGVSLVGKVLLAPTMGLAAFPLVSVVAFCAVVAPAVAHGYRAALRRGSCTQRTESGPMLNVASGEVRQTP